MKLQTLGLQFLLEVMHYFYTFIPSESNAKDSGGLFAWFKGLAGQKTLTKETVEPVLEKMREHLIGEYTNRSVMYMYYMTPKLVLLVLLHMELY